ncbi:hypothetical protein HN681_01945 [archaeon]|jgi:hypothetical protein|nr:hypothetical protein [archaeon]MBT3730961.1 hypothetical protein [archaeon]MBT4669801.1 hypothetical protein [archaeon]MBT5029952.1 hypothetical protein [archaeon]MBT5288523.1 hypothetical protein [archaeon]
MNKKAAVFMYIVCLGFIIAIFMFYGNTGKNSPGGSDLYLGEKQIEVFNTYFEAEKDIYYIELSAKIAAKEASDSNFVINFENYFNIYLEELDQDPDYTFIYDFQSSKTVITGYASEELEYNGDNYVYRTQPNIRIEIRPISTQTTPNQF